MYSHKDTVLKYQKELVLRQAQLLLELTPKERNQLRDKIADLNAWIAEEQSLVQQSN